MLTITEILDDFAHYLGANDISHISVDSRGLGGETALHWMSTLGDANAIHILVSNGADIDAIDSKGNTSLHNAAYSRQAAAVEALMSLGANIKIKNNAGVTVQEITVADGYAPTITLLQNRALGK